jgi:hypothetical protein
LHTGTIVKNKWVQHTFTHLTEQIMNTLTHCLAYLDQLPPAISGSGGHNATFRAACECVRFGLTDAEALDALRRYNARCRPPWSERELQHKLDSARRKATPGEKAGRHYRKPATKPRTTAELAERTARRRRTEDPSTTHPGRSGQARGWRSEDNFGLPPSVFRWQGDFLDFMRECHSGARLRMGLVTLWQSYHAWCARSDFAPIPAGDFAEWLHTTCTVIRDDSGGLWVHAKVYEPWGEAIAAVFDKLHEDIVPNAASATPSASPVRFR